MKKDYALLLAFFEEIKAGLEASEHMIGEVICVIESDSNDEYFKFALKDCPNVTLSIFHPCEYTETPDKPTCCVNFSGDSNNFSCCPATANVFVVGVYVGMCLKDYANWANKNNK